MSSRKLPKLFFDRCLGGRVLRERLVEVGFDPQIVLHDEVLPKDADDLDWVRWVLQEGAVGLTCDLFRNEYQRAALENFRGIVVIFPEVTVEVMVGHILSQLGIYCPAVSIDAECTESRDFAFGHAA